MVEIGFVQGQSDNLPIIDSFMMASFLSNNISFVGAEIRNVKTKRSARESYGDTAIGYVQVKREGPICTVKAKITPEHRVRQKAYSVVLVSDEIKNEIQDLKCQDCAASIGGCKHAVAFLTWLHRRSEEPASTSIDCYWKKSKLSCAGTSQKFILTSQLGKTPGKSVEKGNGDFLAAVLQRSLKEGLRCQLTQLHMDSKATDCLSIHRMISAFKRTRNLHNRTATDFLNFIASDLDIPTHVFQEVCSLTRKQANCPLWYEMRYGRITASKLHEAANCKTLDGTLTEVILGAAKIPDTRAMQRGRDIEPLVLKTLERQLGHKFKECGFKISCKIPIIGGSPDAVTEDYIVEVKCPVKDSTMKNYFFEGVVARKYYTQIQVQMFVLNKVKGVFCVAEPNFETSGKINIFHIDYDEEFCLEAINKATLFWSRAIFPILMK